MKVPDNLFVMLLMSFQGSVPHWSKRCGEAHECERPAGGPLCGRDASFGEGVPVCWDAWRGVSGQLDPRVPNGEFFQPLMHKHCIFHCPSSIQVFLFFSVTLNLTHCFKMFILWSIGRLCVCPESVNRRNVCALGTLVFYDSLNRKLVF